MIRLMSELPPKVLGFEATGKVTAQDYQTVMMPEIRQFLEGGEKLRVVYYLGPDFEGFSVGAMIDDAIVGLGHFSSWERACVVTDVDWVQKAFGLFAAITPMQLRMFPNDQLDAAIAWAAGKDA